MANIVISKFLRGQFYGITNGLIQASENRDGKWVQLGIGVDYRQRLADAGSPLHGPGLGS
ncbi:MAG: hypothetical protein BroJett011_66430 [Chloroflexota bacterium]|nr:MAG: hypothetical protein BroJett011_66430 [Chloroflexota bacterium]